MSGNRCLFLMLIFKEGIAYGDYLQGKRCGVEFHGELPGIVTSRYFIKCHGRLSVIFLEKHPIRKPFKTPYGKEVFSMTEKQKQQITHLRKNGCGYTVVANKVGISKDTVKSFCRRNGLAGERAAAQAGNVPECRECGKPVQQTEGMKPRVFCCDECRVKWWHEHPDKIKRRAVYSFTCAGCGTTFTAYGNSRRKYCSHECYIRNRFKGGDADE